jgi:hypothetical protein
MLDIKSISCTLRWWLFFCLLSLLRTLQLLLKKILPKWVPHPNRTIASLRYFPIRVRLIASWVYQSKLLPVYISPSYSPLAMWLLFCYGQIWYQRDPSPAGVWAYLFLYWLSQSWRHGYMPGCRLRAVREAQPSHLEWYSVLGSTTHTLFHHSAGTGHNETWTNLSLSLQQTSWRTQNALPSTLILRTWSANIRQLAPLSSVN